MATCNTNTLLSSGVQFLMAGGGVSRILRLEMLRQYLLTLDPSADTSINTLLDRGKCFSCLTAGEMKMAKLQLLCEIKGGIA